MRAALTVQQKPPLQAPEAHPAAAVQAAPAGARVLLAAVALLPDATLAVGLGEELAVAEVVGELEGLPVACELFAGAKSTSRTLLDEESATKSLVDAAFTARP